jgi:hypothetical protein
MVQAKGMGRATLLAVGVVVVAIALVVAVNLLSSPSALPASTNVYVNPQQSSCKGGSSFSCTVVLDARQGVVTMSEVKSVVVNGTNTQPSLTGTGTSVTIAVSLQSVSMQRGLGDVGPSSRPPTVGDIVVDLSDGTQVSVVLGAGGILP